MLFKKAEKRGMLGIIKNRACFDIYNIRGMGKIYSHYLLIPQKAFIDSIMRKLDRPIG